VRKNRWIIPIVALILVSVIFVIYFINLSSFQSNAAIVEPINETKKVSVEESSLFKEYLKSTKDFEKLSADEVITKTNNNESFFLYFGRATCPYCREFVPKLDKVSKEKNVVITYLDTEDTDTDIAIQKLREQYDVEFVPTLINISNQGNNVTVFNANNDSLDEFLDYLVDTD